MTPSIYQALAIKHALALYARTGIRVNRDYTPSAMMKMVMKITGQKLRPRDYTGGVEALTTWLEAQR